MASAMKPSLMHVNISTRRTPGTVNADTLADVTQQISTLPTPSPKATKTSPSRGSQQKTGNAYTTVNYYRRFR